DHPGHDRGVGRVAMVRRAALAGVVDAKQRSPGSGTGAVVRLFRPERRALESPTPLGAVADHGALALRRREEMRIGTAPGNAREAIDRMEAAFDRLRTTGLHGHGEALPRALPSGAD